MIAKSCWPCQTSRSLGIVRAAQVSFTFAVSGMEELPSISARFKRSTPFVCALNKR